MKAKDDCQRNVVDPVEEERMGCTEGVMWCEGVYDQVHFSLSSWVVD